MLPWQASLSGSHGNRSNALQLGSFSQLIFKGGSCLCWRAFQQPPSPGAPPGRTPGWPLRSKAMPRGTGGRAVPVLGEHYLIRATAGAP